MHALVIDDSRPIRRIEGDILREIGFEVSEAGNGREGLEKLQTGPLPQLILVDWNMPEMDGLEFIQQVRQDPRNSDITIVMVTTESEPERMVLALGAGADEYLMKPFAKDSLVDKLRLVGAFT
jgi:two-component system, chemotaxis family, chemotaxis protein CheY